MYRYQNGCSWGVLGLSTVATAMVLSVTGATVMLVRQLPAPPLAPHALVQPADPAPLPLAAERPVSTRRAASHSVQG